MKLRIWETFVCVVDSIGFCSVRIEEKVAGSEFSFRLVVKF